MFRSGYILSTPLHITAAIHNKTPVTISIAGEIIEDRCIILAQTEDAITTDTGRYLIAVCELRVR